jgi:hypothetical protein
MFRALSCQYDSNAIVTLYMGVHLTGRALGLYYFSRSISRNYSLGAYNLKLKSVELLRQ